MKKHLTFLTAFVLFCLSLSQQVNAQLPAGVVFDGYKLEKKSTQTPPSTGKVPYGWDETVITILNSPDLDDLNQYLINNPANKWLHNPSTLFAADVPYMWVGGYTIDYNTRTESMKTNISGLQQGTWYTYSFVATANNLDSYTATDLTLGLYFDDVLVASQVIAVGETASRRYFTFKAPAASGELVIGFAGATGGTHAISPWWQIAGGSGEFSLAAPDCTDSGETSVNLNELFTGTLPGDDVVLEWWTSADREAPGVKVTDPTTITESGTYYAFFYDTVNDCYNTDNSTASVVVTILPPCPSSENCYIPITGNDFTWYNISSGFEQWDYYNHHNGWGSIVNSWNSGNIDAPEAGSPLEIYRATTTQPGTTGGFVFDIYAMDNSFNMEINGTKLANQELQFQFDTADQTPGNVQFADGTYPGNGMPQIWELYGDKQSGKPVIRIIIDAAGQAKLYGSKASYDSPAYLLEEMQLTNGNTFNPVTWNETTTNEVIISQLIASTTMMVGNGYGIKKVSCEPCTQQGATGAPDGFTKIGISTMKSQSAGWPENIANGWITMDSKTKGFVITRVQNQSSIADPKEGMLIYDIDAACVKLYNGFGWNCIEKSCNE